MIADWLIRNAMKRPYIHLDGYMHRWWLLPGAAAREQAPKWLRWCPISIRIHHILTPDSGRHLHDHPFDFRTVVLRGWYVEQDVMGNLRLYEQGDSYGSRAERFHRITAVSPGGAWTMFICLGYRGTWGFLVGGRKVPYKTYLAPHEWRAPLTAETYTRVWEAWQMCSEQARATYARAYTRAGPLTEGMRETWDLIPNPDGTATLVGKEIWND